MKAPAIGCGGVGEATHHQGGPKWALANKPDLRTSRVRRGKSLVSTPRVPAGAGRSMRMHSGTAQVSRRGRTLAATGWLAGGRHPVPLTVTRPHRSGPSPGRRAANVAATEPLLAGHRALPPSRKVSTRTQ